MPKQEWKFTDSIDPADRQAIGVVIFSMIRDGESSYATFLQKMDLKGIEGDVMMICHPQTDGTFILGLNFEHFRKLKGVSKRELLKHAVLHIPFGHKSARGRIAVQLYGAELTELSQDLVINQLIDVDVLAVDGVNLPVPEHYGLPKNLTTDGYAERLKTMAESAPSGNVGAGSFALPSPIKMPGKGQNNPHGLPENDSGFTKLDPTDTSDPTEQTGKDLDQATQKLLNNVDDTLNSQRDKTNLKNQGWYAGECEEFIKSLEREAKISWSTLLRRKEGKHTKVSRRPTRRRPSRRIDEYFGHIKKKGVSCLVAVDTSGSMSHKELRCVEAEVKAMHRRKVKIWVVYVDAGIAKGPFEFKNGMKLEEFSGRGGTDFRPAFQCYEEMEPSPDFMVYVTDGYGTAPEDGYRHDILWVLTSTGMTEDAFRANVCEYGDIAILDVEDLVPE